jgi:hypothetical protein
MTPAEERLAQAQRVAAAFGITEADVLRMPKGVVSVFDRKATDLGLTPPQPCEETDESEVLPW